MAGFLVDPRILVMVTGLLRSSCLDRWDCALVDEGASPVCLATALRSPSRTEQPALLLPDNGQKKTLISGILEVTKNR